MKILIAGILADKGGIQSHIRWLARALGEAGIETMALSLGSSKSPPVDESFLRSSWNENVQLSCCEIYSSARANKGISGLRRLREITRIFDNFDPDIYLAIGTGWNLFIPPLLSRSQPVRIFHEVMSGVPDSWKDSRWCVRLWFDEVIGQSDAVSQSFRKHFYWKKNVLTLPALPEPLELTAELPEVLSQALPKRRIKAALFSRLVPHKQAFWLVKQWDSLKDVLSELHIHGTGEEEAKIRRYISEQNLGASIRCCGRYPEGQKYVDLLGSYDMTLLPTIGEEGAPLVLLESMACGVPFVANAVGGIRDYTKNNPHCIATFPNKKCFIEGVKSLSHIIRDGEIDKKTIQGIYIHEYSFDSLKTRWIKYLKGFESNGGISKYGADQS